MVYKMIRAKWYDEDNNWGDKLNPILINLISGQKVSYTKKLGHLKYLVVGSILHHADDNSIVWGAGLISKNHKPKGKPKFCAVRGPLTREILIASGHKCPAVYGDPALLYPRYYVPKIRQKHKIGIIPHYKDKNNGWVKNQDAKIIDIQGDINQVVDDVCSCEVIISSSLHGIIIADAYGIPGFWVKLSDKLIGGDFKFKDYFLSVNREMKLLNPTQNIESQFYNYKINIDLDQLMDSCPFKNEKS